MLVIGSMRYNGAAEGDLDLDVLVDGERASHTWGRTTENLICAVCFPKQLRGVVEDF